MAHDTKTPRAVRLVAALARRHSCWCIECNTRHCETTAKCQYPCSNRHAVQS